MSEAKQKEHVENKEKLICCRCNKELVPAQIGKAVLLRIGFKNTLLV